MGWIPGAKRAFFGLGGILLIVLATLFRETFFAVITTPITAVLASMQVGLTGEWVFRIIVAVVGVFLISVAIGLDKFETPAKKIYGLYRNFRYPQRTQELEAQDRQREQDALDAYFAQMEQWLHDQSRPLRESTGDDEVRTSAQERTLRVLQGVGPDGKRRVIRFLHGHGLINGRVPVVYMHDADLSGASLSRMNLTDVNLDGAILHNTDLNDASSCGYLRADRASQERALQKGGKPEDLAKPAHTSRFFGADFAGADLRNACFVGCNMVDANFAGADLEEADLRGANLRGTHNLTKTQIERAYGSSGWQQEEDMPNTLLPKHLKTPEAWSKLLSQQKERMADGVK